MAWADLEQISKRRKVWDIINQLIGRSDILEINDADHTITDTEGHSVYLFHSLNADRYLYLPTLSANRRRDITVINVSGGYSVFIVPEGSDTINGWNAPVEITETKGWWRFVGGTYWWHGMTDGWSTVYTTIIGANDNVAADGSWDDVTGLSLTPTVGGYKIDTEAIHWIRDDGQNILYSRFGIGTVSGNNAPNVIDGQSYDIGYVGVNASPGMYGVAFPHKIFNYPYHNNSAQTFYMKVQVYTSTLPAYQTLVYNEAYIKMRRTY